jgi:serine/threonine protein kinase
MMSTDDKSEGFTGTERFELLRCLGAGGMGVVYEALDRQRQERVALKTLSGLRPENLYYLKQEFRALADISHPNLVTLYELFAVEGHWFFTMELVPGVNFLDYVSSVSPDGSTASSTTASYVPSEAGRSETAMPLTQTVQLHGGEEGPSSRPRPPRVHLGRLRAALGQLAEGIYALHQADKLHRDIKPSNVLVTPAGRVVLLDFGLVADLPLAGQGAPAEEIVGTLSYMAPEQAAGAPLTPASDWYSVGVMLYQALAGRLPFTGSRSDIWRAKLHSEPPPPSTWSAEVPADLEELCLALLRRRPEDRPAETDILRRLGASPTTANYWLGSPGRGLFLGRDRELAELHRAYQAMRQGQTCVVCIRGASGVGKSALLQRFLEEVVRQEAPLILNGRCYERELVPYKALDSLIDALSRLLQRLSPEECASLLPADLPALARLFPVLHTWKALAPAQTTEVPSQQELRRRAFLALRLLLRRLGERQPLIIAIDDLQWGDEDSAALLCEVLRPPDPPRLLLVLIYRREDEASSRCLRTLLSDIGNGTGLLREQVTLEPLPASATQQLAGELLAGQAPEMQQQAAAVAQESGGMPYLVQEIVQHLRQQGAAALAQAAAAGLSLEVVLQQRVAQLPEEPRRLLEVVAVSGKPLRQGVACRAAGLAAGADRTAILTLRTQRLVRCGGLQEQDEIETYHDRVRETLLANLPAAQLREYHRRLAEALAAAGQADAEELARHYHGAGEQEPARRYYLQAAQEAAQALAFDRAAQLYRQALELSGALPPDELRNLRSQLAEALANAGRGAEAAREYLAVAALSPSAASLNWQYRAAFQYCISGHLDEGRAIFRQVLRAIGLRLPRSPLGAILTCLAYRGWLRLRGLHFQERPESQVAPEELLRLDILRSVAVGISVMDPVCGARFQTQSLLLALRCGEPRRLALSLAWEAAHSALRGGPGQKRTAQLLEAAQRLAAHCDSPQVQGMLILAQAIRDFFLGRFRTAADLATQAETLFRDRCTGVIWEVDTAHAFALWSLLYMGELVQLRQRFFELFQRAQERGDRYDAANLGTQIGILAYLAEDRPEAAEELVNQVMQQWTQEGFNIQHLSAEFGRIYLDLYRGRGRAAWERLPAIWRRSRRSFHHLIQQVRIDLYQLGGRAALAAACEAANPRPYWRAAEHFARRLEKEQMPWAKAFARLLYAGLAAQRRQTEQAITLFAEAALRFESLPMQLFAAAARRRQGELLGGAQGQALCAAADAWLAQQHIRNPSRLLAAVAVPVGPSP